MKKILVNANPWQTRIAITWNNQLENIYFENPRERPLERVFFKGVVTKILPGIQTAFVDIGQDKAGFLHISEIDREMALENISKFSQIDVGDEPIAKPKKQQVNIANILKEGESVLVQVSKEPMYEKGAKLTTCFTLPGRFVVLMPNIPRIGVSKKIEDRDERTRLKTLVKDALPEGMGAIIRTTCEGRKAAQIVKDLNFLVETWNTIQNKFDKEKPKARLHEDLDLALQIVRDHLDEDVQAVIADNPKEQKNIYKFIKHVAPEFSHAIKLYEGQTPLFEHYQIEEQIQAALEKKVELKSGGSLIIETTEAMTVIDVNTGRFTGRSNLEDTISKTNIEAAEEIARQLRLRNIGGLIVIDFIDMASYGNRQKLYNFFEKILRERDKFQSVVLKVSEFGLVQMTRKRSGKTLVQQLTTTCPTCSGLGFIKSIQTDAFTILRHIKNALHITDQKNVLLHVNPVIFNYLTTFEYDAILELEKEFNAKITFSSDETYSLEEFELIQQ